MSDPATLALAAVDSPAPRGAPSAAPGQPLIDFVSRLVGEAADWEFVFSNADYLGVGALLTIGLTAASILPSGSSLAFRPARSRCTATAPQTGRQRGRDRAPRTPIVVILIVMYFVVGVPQINLGVASISSAMTAGILGLGLRSAAYQSQIFRATLSSVDDGQLEAGRSIGLAIRGGSIRRRSAGSAPVDPGLSKRVYDRVERYEHRIRNRARGAADSGIRPVLGADDRSARSHLVHQCNLLRPHVHDEPRA